MLFLSIRTAFRYFPALLTLLMFGCSANQSSRNGDTTRATAAVSSKKEDFGLFFKKFQSDSVFQLSRVSFPLKAEAKSDDGDSTRLVDKKDWTYTSIISGKIDRGIIHKKKLSANGYLVQCQVSDTGIELDYHFINKDGKWQLKYVEDYSD